MSVLTQTQAATDVSASQRELTALSAGCAVYRANKALFSLTGRDRVRWLNGMVTNNIRDLATGSGVYAFVLNAQGHILGDLYVFNRGESLMVEIDGEQADSLMQILRRYIIMDKVEVEDLREKIAVIGVAGPRSNELLGAIGFNLDATAMTIADAAWNNVQMTIARGDNPCVSSYEVWIPVEESESLIQALEKSGAETVGDDAIETLRILCGIPKVGKDIREKTLPHETGQDRALNFTKGCYIGQEIVERIRARGAVHRTFVGFEVEGALPSTGTKIQADGKDVGEITSVLAQPFKQKQLGLGFLRKEYLHKELSAGQAKVAPVALPFADFTRE